MRSDIISLINFLFIQTLSLQTKDLTKMKKRGQRKEKKDILASLTFHRKQKELKVLKSSAFSILLTHA